MLLADTRAIITGAAGGLGRCFTLELLKAGAMVAAGDIDLAGLEQLRQESRTYLASPPDEGRLLTGKLDVSQEASVTAFVKQYSAQLKGANLLVNNAGVLRDGLLAKSEAGWVRKLPTAQWKQAIDINLTGGYLMAREFIAEVLERKIAPSVIINISSMSSAGNPGQSNYAASKAGLDACTRTWALELAAQGIRVGGIAPGVIDTPMLNQVAPETKNELLEQIPIGRPGAPHDIWLALKFIIECEFFTGRVIAVDGGADF